MEITIYSLIGYTLLILICSYLKFNQTKYSETLRNIFSLFTISTYIGIIISFVSQFFASSLTGIYHDTLNNSIELKSDGTVHFNHLEVNSVSCQTTGNWNKLDSNHIKINFNINSNCSFISCYSGNWEIKGCLKYRNIRSVCLAKNNEFQFKK